MFDDLKGLSSRVKLHNGVEMPIFGLGVWRMRDGDESKIQSDSLLNMVIA